MAYVALYRKYRSQSFGEVVGQEHVTTVLQNAIRLGRIAHAYLFCGPRGCGKTSTARLLARALNCQAADRPTSEPCGVCDMCVRIREGAAMDVIEMDAASETGIDDVREKIIENAKYAPGEARYKVYIIDEVHDLSLKAFDSLLKTIEEPPAHVVFVLATTEAHKVPITIRSRCQRMDFRRGTLVDLTANLRRVLDKESIPFEPEAVAAVARAAEGSFRDSLSLLEQVLAYTDGRLTSEAVHASIGTVGPQVLDDLTRTLASDDLRAAYTKAGELVDSGKDVKQTLVALQGHLRDLLVAGLAGGPEALSDVSAERFAQLQEQSRGFSPAQLLRMLDVLAESERDIRFTNQHRLLLERALWSILPSSLAAQAVGHAPAVAVPAAAARPTAATAEQPPAPRPMAPPPAPARQDAAALKAEPAPEPVAVTTAPEPLQPAPKPEAAPLPPVPEADEDDEAAVDPAVFAPTLTLEVLQRAWPRVRSEICRKSPTMRAKFTEDVQPVALSGRHVDIGFPNEFARSQADKPKGREFMEQMLCAALGMQGLKVRCILLAQEPAPPAPAPAPPGGLDLSMEAPAPSASPQAAAAVATEPAVQAAPKPAAAAVPSEPAESEDEFFLNLVMEEFNGTLVDDEES